MNAETLFDAIVAAGIEHTNHESDLYLPDSPEVRAILARYPQQQASARPFTNQRQPNKGQAWLDVPFAFLPYWRARAK